MSAGGAAICSDDVSRIRHSLPSLLRACDRGDRLFFYNLWFRGGHNNVRYANLLPFIERLDIYLSMCSSRPVVRGVQFRALRAASHARYSAVFAAAARQYRYAFVTDFRQIAHFRGKVVVDVDDPTFSVEEAALLGRTNVAACVVTDERAVLRYEALGVTKPICVIPQPVCLDVFDADKAARIRAGREQQGIVFGHVAAWLRLRGDSRHGNALYDIDHLLDLWTDVRLKVPRSRLWLMGEPSPRVRRRCAQLDDVVLLGRLRPDELLAHLANVDIALYARTAGGGMQRMKIAEYIAMGVPTVAYEHDETRILQTTRTGILVSSAHQFVDAVTSLAEDEAKRREMSAAGHSLAPQFAAEGLARRYEREVFDQYLS